jgi:integrase
VIQAVGMADTARAWAADRGIALSPRIDGDLAEVLVRYLTQEREVSARTIHDYLERLRIFALRGGLLAGDDHGEIGAILSDLRAEAEDTDPAKRAKVRAFRRSFDLADVLLRARALGQAAAALPDWSAGAERKRRAAVILALLVNTADRQGDLSCHRIGHELQREADGSWVLDFHQSKTGRRKASGALWPITTRLIEDHILAGRPDWCLPDRLAELQGCNLLSLAPRGFGLYHPSAILREEFGISGHLVRTLITDAVRNGRPDAAWAAQALMGHVNRTMQETYRVDFRETAAIRSWHDTLEALQARVG